MKQDRNGVRTAQDLERKYNFAENFSSIKKAIQQSEEGITKVNQELDNFIDVTTKNFEEIDGKLDGQITTYYYSGVPTLSNYPASEWSYNEYDSHIGDLYYDKDTSYAYKFLYDNETGVYLWVEEKSSEVTEALELAQKAQDTADGKRRVFTTTPFTPYDVGDLWLYNNELYVCQTSSTTEFSANHFKKATKYTDDTALNNFVSGTYADDLEAIEETIDKKAETWYQSTDPSGSWTTAELKTAHVGDLWYNTALQKSYIYSSNHTWQEADGVPDSVYDEIDGKAQIFTTQPTTPYHKGDMYTQGANGDILVCTTERLTGNYTASDWTKAGKYTDDSALNNFVDVTFASAIDTINESIDTKITTWYYSGVPTLSNAPANGWTTNEERSKHTGDLYYDKSTGKAYIFELNGNAYSWLLVEDSDVSEALALANASKDTADSKRRVFTGTPFTPYDNGDLWVRDGEIYICQISKAENESYAENDFINNLIYTDDTLATQVGDNLEVVRGQVLTVTEGVDAFKLDFETQIKTINDLQQETLESVERMSYTFGTQDFTIANSNEPFNARMNNQGLKVYTYNTLNSIFNHRGAGFGKLIVTGDSQLANISVTKATDENGEPCTDINHLVSNIQDLTDLEVD
jgi:phage-related protein